MVTSIIKPLVLTSLVLFLNCSFALAQQPLFKVYAVTGKVRVHEPGKKYRPLRVADELSGNETLKVANGAVVNLVCSNYAPVQISKAGTHAVSSFSGNCSKEQAGLFTKYFEYIWTELFHKHSKPEAAPLQSMQNKGAVSRGCPDIEIFYPTDTLKLVTQNWELSWNASGAPVSVAVYNSEYDGLQTYKTTPEGTSVSTASFFSALSDEELNYLQLAPENASTCPRYPVVRTGQQAFEVLVNSYAGALPQKGTSSYFFMRSFVEEDLKYLGEALGSIQKAIALEPANQVYQNHLALFKARYNLQ